MIMHYRAYHPIGIRKQRNIHPTAVLDSATGPTAAATLQWSLHTLTKSTHQQHSLTVAHSLQFLVTLQMTTNISYEQQPLLFLETLMQLSENLDKVLTTLSVISGLSLCQQPSLCKIPNKDSLCLANISMIPQCQSLLSATSHFISLVPCFGMQKLRDIQLDLQTYICLLSHSFQPL